MLNRKLDERTLGSLPVSAYTGWQLLPMSHKMGWTWLAHKMSKTGLSVVYPWALALDIKVTYTLYWWLVGVALMFDFVFLPQHFGLVVGTYELLLSFCECTWGGGSICRWWGHLTTICANQTFCRHRWWGPKNLVSNNCCSPCPLTPLCFPCPSQVVRTQKPSIR